MWYYKLILLYYSLEEKFLKVFIKLFDDIKKQENNCVLIDDFCKCNCISFCLYMVRGFNVCEIKEFFLDIWVGIIKRFGIQKIGMFVFIRGLESVDIVQMIRDSIDIYNV